jgi:hypothetical protein
MSPSILTALVAQLPTRLDLASGLDSIRAELRACRESPRRPRRFAANYKGPRPWPTCAPLPT